MSTVDGHLAFGRMLLNGGVHQGRRLLSAESVRDMTADHISAERKAASPFFPRFWDTHGWGYGVRVSTAADAISSTPGRYGWDGGLGTSWINDPGKHLVGIVMTQSSDFLFSALDAFCRDVYSAVA